MLLPEVKKMCLYRGGEVLGVQFKGGDLAVTTEPETSSSVAVMMKQSFMSSDVG